MAAPSNRMDSASGVGTIVPVTLPANALDSHPLEMGAEPTRPRHYSDRPAMVPQRMGTRTRLSQEETRLLSVFRRRSGQIISLARLARLIYDEGGLVDAVPSQGSRRALSPARCMRVVEALQRKLQSDEAGRRLLKVDGCGYVLWPC
jgi:DNA-binding response OmpR family regulator